MIFCDAHLHLSGINDFCGKKELLNGMGEDSFYWCSSMHTDVELNVVDNMILDLPKGAVPLVKKSFGILPQKPDVNQLEFLIKLLKEKKIEVIGEAGFDFYTKEYKSMKEEQQNCFEKQAELAAEYRKPFVIHNRKALDMIFEYKNLLCDIPSVIFHGFSFGPIEAESVLSKGINAYFSFGKQILNGNKKSISCVQNMSPDRILLETDAPFGTLKNEIYTNPLEIKNVYEKTAEIKQLNIEKICERIKENFIKAFCVLN